MCRYGAWRPPNARNNRSPGRAWILRNRTPRPGPRLSDRLPAADCWPHWSATADRRRPSGNTLCVDRARRTRRHGPGRPRRRRTAWTGRRTGRRQRRYGSTGRDWGPPDPDVGRSLSTPRGSGRRHRPANPQLSPGFADLATNVACQALPQRAFGVKVFEAVGVARLGPVARPDERQAGAQVGEKFWWKATAVGSWASSRVWSSIWLLRALAYSVPASGVIQGPRTGSAGGWGEDVGTCVGRARRRASAPRRAAALDCDRVPLAGRNRVEPPGLMEDGFLVWRRGGRDRPSIDASCSGGAIKHRDGHALTVIDF